MSGMSISRFIFIFVDFQLMKKAKQKSDSVVNSIKLFSVA